MDQKSYRKIFRDIVVGKSISFIDNQKFYIKHLSALDQVEIDDIYSNYYRTATSRGIPKEEDRLKELISSGDWGDDKDKEIDTCINYIEQLKKAKTQIVLKSQIDHHNNLIKETEEKLFNLNQLKKDLIGISAESYADKRSNDYYIIKSFFEDEDCKKAIFPNEEDFNDLYSEDVAKFIKEYNKVFEMFEESTIQEMILQDFYYIYFPFSDDTVGFFGNPVCHLTYNQLKLIVYTKIFKNIFEQNSNIPEKIKKDPKALLDYGSVSEDVKDKMKKKINSETDGMTLVGATQEDYEYAGIQTSKDSTRISLQKAAENKGGSLTMEDLMELSGYRK